MYYSKTLLEVSRSNKLLENSTFRLFALAPFLFLLLIYSQSLNAQAVCPGNPPEGITIAYVGSNYGVETLSEAISLGYMEESPGSGNPWPAQWIFVSGWFVLDNPGSYTDYVFNNSEIYMDADASMEIPNEGMQVGFVNSQVKGCDEMWDRIFVQAGAKVVASGSLFRDAFHAFYLEPGTNFQARLCHFNENLNGIYYGYGNHTNTVFSVSISTFQGSPQGLISDVGYFNTAYAGIVLNDDPGCFGIGHNVFDGVQNGIMAYWSCLNPNVNINYGQPNIFRNIRPGGATTDDLYGNGIAFIGECSNGVSSVIGLGNQDYENFGHLLGTYSENFYNCTRGVYGINSNANVYRNLMRENALAVEITQSSSNYNPNSTKGSNISNNFIEDSDISGIYFNMNYSGYAANVLQNEITLNNSSFSHGIHAVAGFVPNDLDILDNIIDIETAGIGIEIDGVQTVKVGDNEVTVTGTGYNYKGIFLNNGATDNIIVNNELFGQDQGFYIMQTTQQRLGIQLNNAPANILACNKFDRVATGMNFRSSCFQSDVWSNDFVRGTDGLTLGFKNQNGMEADIIGQQIFGEIGANNKFATATNSYTNEDAKLYTNQSYVAEESRFFIDEEDDLPTFNHILWPDKIEDPTGVWIEQNDNAFPISINCNNLLTGGNEPEEFLRNLEISVLEADTSAWKEREFLEWMVEWGLLRKLNKDTTLFSEHVDATTWYNSKLNTPQGELFQVLHIYEEIVGVSNADLTELASAALNSGVSFQILDSLAQRLLLNDSLSTTESTLWSAALDTLVIQKSLSDSILNLHRVQLGIKMDSLLSQLGQINTSHPYDSILKVVFAIYWDECIRPDSSLTSTSEVILDAISLSCANTDGMGVWMARNILKSIGKNVPNFDDDVCYIPTAMPSATKAITQMEGWQIAPNPGNDYVIISSEKNNEDIQVMVYDITGQIVNQYQSSGQALKLDTIDWPRGMYFIQMMRTSGQNTTLKWTKSN
jgi:hypothetical protein